MRCSPFSPRGRTVKKPAAGQAPDRRQCPRSEPGPGAIKLKPPRAGRLNIFRLVYSVFSSCAGAAGASLSTTTILPFFHMIQEVSRPIGSIRIMNTPT